MLEVMRRLCVGSGYCIAGQRSFGLLKCQCEVGCGLWSSGASIFTLFHTYFWSAGLDACSCCGFHQRLAQILSGFLTGSRVFGSLSVCSPLALLSASP